jgi:hypothetical protein
LRTAFDDASVRLYHLDAAPDGNGAQTLFYGSLSEALIVAAQQLEEVQDGLYIATDNDVIAYLDLIAG